MNKKQTTNFLSQNITFFILAIFATITFMMQICSSLYTIKGGGVLNNVHYSLFQIKIDVTRDTYRNLYDIWNYPLIPIFAGILNNIYYIFKNHKIKSAIGS